LAGVEALAAKIDDPVYKAEVLRQIEDLKKRRLAIEKNFDPGLYEVLMHSVISRYQVIALWLKPAPLPAPALAAIENVEIGKNRELCVDGKPFFPPSSWGQSPQRFPLLRRLGFNIFTSGKASEYCDAAQQAGGYAIPGFDPRGPKCGWPSSAAPPASSTSPTPGSRPSRSSGPTRKCKGN
jgi:hypothetical protein